jgi:hypothetical protein
MTSEEKANFKGGPMPPEAAAKMAEAMRASAARAEANKAAKTTPPAAPKAQ